MGVANAHPLGATPFSRAEYINKFKILTDDILDHAESERFLELVQQLPDLSHEEVCALNPIVPEGYLVENPLTGIF